MHFSTHSINLSSGRISIIVLLLVPVISKITLVGHKYKLVS